MAERIEFPPNLTGEAEDQIRQIYRYLRRIVEQLNNNQLLTDENLSGYLSTQTNALRQISGSTEQTGQAESVQDAAAALVETLSGILQQVKSITTDIVTPTRFTELFQQRARTTPVTPAGSSTSFVMATAIRQLQEADASTAAEIAKLMDQTGETISGSWKGFIYSGQVGTEGGNPVYGFAIGPDVVTWDAGGNASYQPANAWVIFDADGGTIGGSAISTAADLAERKYKYATGTAETDADMITAPGEYIIEVNSATQTHFPSSLTDGDRMLLEVIADKNGTIILQRLWSAGSFFSRLATSGSWSGWFAYTGTAV